MLLWVGDARGKSVGRAFGFGGVDCSRFVVTMFTVCMICCTTGVLCSTFLGRDGAGANRRRRVVSVKRRRRVPRGIMSRSFRANSCRGRSRGGRSRRGCMSMGRSVRVRIRARNVPVRRLLTGKGDVFSRMGFGGWAAGFCSGRGIFFGGYSGDVHFDR